MSGGRWVREDNGDYQHYTDDEIAEQQRSKLGLLFALMLVGGPILMYYFNYMIIGGIITLIGVIGFIKMPTNTLGGLIVIGLLFGLLYFLYSLGKDDEEKEKKEKTEKIAQAPSSANNQSNMASFKAEESNETVEAYEEPANEEVEDDYSSNETAMNEESSSSENSINDGVEVMPEFPGGPQALFNYLNANVKFPRIAEENGIQGKVVVSYVIDIDGSVTDVQVVQSVHPALDKEAMRVIKNMPKWIPGKHDGKAVQVKYSVPINFYYQ